MGKIIVAVACIVGMVTLAIFAGKAHAQGFDDGPCYSWEGGHKSAGSYSKCPTGIPPARPRAVATPAPAPQIAPSPIMMPMTCPPPASKPIVKPKHKTAKKC